MYVQLSVVIPTRNRQNKVKRAIASVLAQAASDVELVVVDDNSTDASGTYFAGIASDQIIVVANKGSGAAAARNTGLEKATGRWVAFLDDDDVMRSGWVRVMTGLINDQTGLVCCGAEFKPTDGSKSYVEVPRKMGRMRGNMIGLILGGTFAARTDIVRDIGGYDENLPSRQQTDLGLRLVPEIQARGLTIAVSDEVLVEIEERPPGARQMAEPAKIYNSTVALLEKHREKFAADRGASATSNAIVGVSGVRIGKTAEAKDAFLRSVRARPWRLKGWLRLVAVHIPALRRRTWPSEDR